MGSIWSAYRMSSRASLIMLSILVIMGLTLVSAYPSGGEGRYQTSHIKRGNYDDIMEQFGSDGYLYDFTKRSPKDYMGQFGSDGYLYDFSKKRSRGFGKSKYPIWGGFGSDGYLYDFTK